MTFLLLNLYISLNMELPTNMETSFLWICGEVISVWFLTSCCTPNENNNSNNSIYVNMCIPFFMPHTMCIDLLVLDVLCVILESFPCCFLQRITNFLLHGQFLCGQLIFLTQHLVLPFLSELFLLCSLEISLESFLWQAHWNILLIYLVAFCSCCSISAS